RLRAALKPPPPASSCHLPGLEAPGTVCPEIRPRRSRCAPPKTRTLVMPAAPPRHESSAARVCRSRRLTYRNPLKSNIETKCEQTRESHFESICCGILQNENK